MASHLTSTEAQLIAAWLTAVGGSGNALTKSREQILAEIRNVYGGSLSHLTTKVADLIAGIDTAAGGAGDALTESVVKGLAGINTVGGGSGSELTSGFAALLAGIATNASAPSSEPEWLPEGAAFHVDFDNAQYYWGGAEKVQADLPDVLGDNLLLPDRAYNASNIGANGYAIAEGAGGLSFVGTLLSAIVSANFTMLLWFDTDINFEMTEASFMTDIIFDYNDAALGQLQDQNNPDLEIAASGGAHKAAITITAAAAYGSVDNVRLQDGDTNTSYVPTIPETIEVACLAVGPTPLKRITVWTTPKSEAATQALTA